MFNQSIKLRLRAIYLIRWVFLDGWCLIDGKCHTDGWENYDNKCEYCDASIDTKNWTVKSSGESCGDDMVCNEDAQCEEPPYEIPEIKTVDDFKKVRYVDTSAETNGNGTIGSPYNMFIGLPKLADTAYLFKAGTTVEGNLTFHADNNYFGRYGEGDDPIFLGALEIKYDGLTIDHLQLLNYGTDSNTNYNVKFGRDLYPSNITIANSLIKGLDNGKSYPDRNIVGWCGNCFLYKNEIGYASSVNMFVTAFSKISVVSNYFHDSSNSLTVSAASSNDPGVYIANNYLSDSGENRQDHFSSDSQGYIFEWNTIETDYFDWTNRPESVFRYNLLVNDDIFYFVSKDEIVNQPEPYGVFDNYYCLNKWATPNVSTGLHERNMIFDSKDALESYISENNAPRYGSDLAVAQ